MDLNQLEAIGKYIFSAAPQLKENHETYFFGDLRKIYSLRNQKVPLPDPLTEDELNGLKTPKDFFNQLYKFDDTDQYTTRHFYVAD